MTPPADARPGANHIDPDESAWRVSVDVDLQTALALARASTRALLELSPLSHREITQALTEEIERLENQSDPLSLAAANAVRRHLPKAA
jgi:hypothetical protein